MAKDKGKVTPVEPVKVVPRTPKEELLEVIKGLSGSYDVENASVDELNAIINEAA